MTSRTEEYYSIYDKVAKIYIVPYLALNDEDAIRAFRTLVQNPKTPFNAHPSDYELYHIGRFDFIDGIMEGGTMDLVVKGSSFIINKENTELPLGEVAQIGGNNK